MNTNEGNESGATETSPPVVTPMDAFFTRPAANEGIEFPLVRPDGTPTEHWLRLRGIDSDEYRLADLDSKRRAVKIAETLDLRERDKQVDELTLRLIATLVMSWSLPQECTLTNVMNFLREAPQIASAVERVTGNRRLFFALGYDSSESTPEPTTN